VRAAIDAANEGLPEGDAEPFASYFTEDAYFFDIDGGSFGIVGRDAIEHFLSQEPDEDFHVELVEATADGNTVTGVLEVVDADAVAAGVDRYVQPFTAVVEGDLLASLVFTYDEDDAQTAEYLAYQASVEEDDDELPPGTVTLSMTGDQPGQAFVGEFEGFGFVGSRSLPATASASPPTSTPAPAPSRGRSSTRSPTSSTEDRSRCSARPRRSC
jgi:hypothetical protein